MYYYNVLIRSIYTERVIGDTEHVLALQDGLSQFELKKRKSSPKVLSPSHSHSHSSSHSHSRPHSHSHKPTKTPMKVTFPSEHIDSPSNRVELRRSKLDLHSDLIQALREFASSSKMKKRDVTSVKTRESVLEQAVVEQNEILDVMQEVIASLEKENQLSSEKIETQGKLIQDSVGVESRARKAERQLRELRDAKRSSLGSLKSENAATGSSFVSFEKALAQKDQRIASLQAKLNAIPLDVRQESGSERQRSPSSSSSIRVHLTAERMRVIELEEELGAKKAELAKIKHKFTEHRSTMQAKETEIQHLRHELELQKKSSSQQKILLGKQRQAMMEKDEHLISLARALEKEKKVAEQMRKRPLQSGYNTPSATSSKVADFLMPTTSPGTLSKSTNSMSKLELTNLYDLVSGRDIHAVQITRHSGSSSELGFTYAKTELPISSKLSCLIVKSVERDSLVFGKLLTGDEIVEVNGYACRSPDQRTAIECLETGNGVIKIVLARDRDLSLQMQAHSTPLMPRTVNKREDTTVWATALPNASDTMFASFTDSFGTPRGPGNKTEYISFPSNSQSSTEIPLAGESATYAQTKPPSSSPPPPTSLSGAPEGENQAYKEMKADEGTIQELQEEVGGLQEQLDESEHSRLELEGEVEALRTELDNLQKKLESTKSQNIHLQHEAASHGEEMANIRQNVLELQSLLVKLKNQVTDDQERIASLENHNKGLSNELIEAKLLSDASVKEKVDIEDKVRSLKEELAVKAEADRKRNEDFQQLLSDKDSLTANVELRDARIKKLSTKLEKNTTEHQQLQLEAEQQSRQLHSEISSLKETTVKSSSSAQQEQDHLQAQFTSVKNLLMEAQMKEAEQKVEMRYLKQAADMANEQLKVHEERYRRKEEELAVFKQLVESKTLEMESMTLGLKATQHKLEAKKEMLTRLQNEVDSLRRNCAKLQNEKSQTTEALNNLKSNLKAAESEVIRIKKKLDESVNEKDTLFQQLEESISESTGLQQEVDQLRNSLKEAETIKERGRELSSKVEELTEEKRVLEEELAKQIDSFKAEKKVLESELSQSRSDSLSKSTTVQEQLSRQEEEIKRQRDRLVTCEGEKAKLSHSCDNLRKREGELSEQIEILKTGKESLVSELKTATSQKDHALRELEACQKKTVTLNQQCSSIKEEKQMVEAAAEALRNELKESVSDSERLTSNREELVQQLKTLEGQLDEARNEFKRKSHEFQKLNASHSQLTEKSKIEQGRLEELKSSFASLNDRNTKLQTEKKRSDDMVASLEFMHQQTQTRLEQVSDTVQIKEAEVDRLKGELNEVTTSLKKERAETSSLKESLSSTKERLDKSETRRNKEVGELKEQLSVYMKEIGELQEELQTEKSASVRHQSLITQLKSNVEHANKERYTVQSGLDAALKEKSKLETTNKQLEGQLARSRSEISQLEDSGNFMSSESANLKLQLKQCSHETDELTAQVHAMEMNLEVANRTLDESEREKLEWTSQRENMELQLEDLKSGLKQSQASLEETSLQLHTRDEELSKAKSSLELRQRECDKLQESIIAVNSSVQTYEKRVGTLESEKLDLQAALERIQEEQKRSESSLLVLDKEKQDVARRLTNEIEALQNQCSELRTKADSDSSRMEKLERSKREAEDNVAQLLAAQEALKTSINSLGDEKEVEIVELQSKVAKLKKEVGETKRQLEESLSKGKEREEKLEEDYRVSLERCDNLERENEALKEIAQEHANTSDKLSELNSKMATLQKSLKTKTEQLSDAEQSIQQATSDLKVTRSENEALLGKVSELASVKVSLVEKSAEMDKLRGQLAQSSNQLKDLMAERDKLLTTLRKLEVEKHSAAVKQVTPELPRSPGIGKEELLALLRDKEEEASKLKDYVNRLLSVVIEKAPFILENV